MAMELLLTVREMGARGFAMGDGANINRVAQLLLAVLTIAFLSCGSLRSHRRRRLQRSIISVLGAPTALDILPKATSATRMVIVTTSQLESSPTFTRFAPHGSRIACKPKFDHARLAGERRLHNLQRAESRDIRMEALVSAMAMRQYSGFALSLFSLKGLNAERICVPRVPAFVRKIIDEEQSLARREAVYAADSSCDTDSTGGKKLEANKKDTKGLLLGLLRNFLGAACLHLAALPRSLLTSFTSVATEVRRGSNHLTTTPKNQVIVGDMKVLFFTSIAFHFTNAEDQTDNGKPVDPEAWNACDVSKTAAMFLLASSIGGVGVAVWILYNRRKTFSPDDIKEGLMRGPDVVRRDNPTFEILPSIEQWSDTE